MQTLLKRVHELELEIQKLKAQLRPNSRQTAQVVKKSVGFVLTYWTLLSFVVALGIAAYIKYAFDVDYFENYRSLAASRKISEFHTKMGDHMLRHQEWAAAEDAFKKALEANSNNTGASYGLVKAGIFKPLPGEKFTWPETQAAMLRFLREERPDDPDLDLFEAFRSWNQSNREAAVNWAMKALEKQPDYGFAQMLMGHIMMSDGDIQKSEEWCRKAVASLPDNASACGNLAFILLLQRRYEESAQLAEKAYLLGGEALTSLVLSDALRFMGRAEEGVRYSRSATASLLDAKINDSRIAGGEWVYNFMPLTETDAETWKSSLSARALPRKQAIAHLAWAMDLALTGDFSAADKAWEKAVTVAPLDETAEYIQNKLAATLALAKLPDSPDAVDWLKVRLVQIMNPESMEKEAEVPTPGTPPAPEDGGTPGQ